MDQISKTKVQTDLQARDSASQVINKVRDNLDYLKQHKGQVTIAAIDKATNVISETKNRVLALSGKTFRFTLGVIDKATAPLQKIWNYATSLKGIMTGIFAGAAAQKFVMKPAQMAIDRQNVTTAFENLLGSKDAATERVSDLTSFAGQTPFTRDEILRLLVYCRCLLGMPCQLLMDLRRLVMLLVARNRILKRLRSGWDVYIQG